MSAQTLSLILLGGATALYAIAFVAFGLRVAWIPAERRAARKALGIARAGMLVGVVMHAAGVVARAVEAGHVPWSTMYEYTISASLFAVIVYVVLNVRRPIPWIGAGVSGLATMALGLALAELYAEATPLQPALQNLWITIHVSIAILATGILSVGAVIAVLYLLRSGQNNSSRLAELPEPKVLESLAFRLHALGFVAWTFAVVSGAIWAADAWGRAWGWDPKEVGSFVVWVVYAAYLHARTTAGWTGKRAMVIALVGFVALILNLTVVNFLLDGLHSYA